MGRGGKNWDPPLLANDQKQQSSSKNNKRQYTWNEIRRHSDKKDRWLVIDKHVYDVTRWTKHPGGQVVLNHYAGQDATVRKKRNNEYKNEDFVFLRHRKLFVLFILKLH